MLATLVEDTTCIRDAPPPESRDSAVHVLSHCAPRPFSATEQRVPLSVAANEHGLASPQGGGGWENLLFVQPKEMVMDSAHHTPPMRQLLFEATPSELRREGADDATATVGARGSTSRSCGRVEPRCFYYQRDLAGVRVDQSVFADLLKEVIVEKSEETEGRGDEWFMTPAVLLLCLSFSSSSSSSSLGPFLSFFLSLFCLLFFIGEVDDKRQGDNQTRQVFFLSFFS